MFVLLAKQAAAGRARAGDAQSEQPAQSGTALTRLNRTSCRPLAAAVTISEAGRRALAHCLLTHRENNVEQDIESLEAFRHL